MVPDLKPPMLSIFNPRERFILRATLLLLMLGALGAGIATILHQLNPDPHPFDLFLSPILLVFLLFLFGYLYLKPNRITAVLWTGFISVLISILLPAWFFTIQAANSPEITLVDTFPPITSLLLSVIMGMVVFLHSRLATIVALVFWTLVALPIMVYLAFHSEELWSPRGLEMVITLGPVMMVIMALVPFRHGLEQRFISLQTEHTRMQWVAERDSLTKLYNRHAGESLLINFMSDHELNCGLIMFDIDHFKSINDSHGHGTGDEVLREVARRCSLCLRKDDPLVRWGGEEFLVLIRRAGYQDIECIAENLC